MRRITLPFILSILCLCIGTATYAQLSQGGTPMSFTKKGITNDVPVYTLPTVDVESLLAEDEVNQATKVGPYRFGAELPVDITLANSGNWEALRDGKLWRQSIKSTGAYSINLIFEDFYLPEGSRLFIYNKDKSTVMGAFTEKNNKPHGYFATNLIEGDQITLEYYEPTSVEGMGHFKLVTVVHAYKNVIQDLTKAGSAGGSGACNINVNCPLGTGWENERNSVTRIVLGGGLCSGALVNNTANDGTPYYLTANHCYQGTNPATWVFNFNLQSATCNGNSGSGQSLTGAIFRANNSGSDFALVEIDDPIPSNYNPYLAGWRNNNTASASSICIHHPSGDIKKISRDQNAPTSSSFSGASTWRIGAWEEGTTEGGSSGSPLFDEATHQIIGQLYGGSAACSGSNPNNQPDFYGKFSTSWDGSSSSNRLRDWLDPGNTGATSVTGLDPFAPQFALDAGVVSIVSPENGATICDNSITPVVTISNNGATTLTTLTVTINVDGTPYTINWTGSLSSFESEDVTFSNLTLSTGAHTITASVSAPNNGTDQNSTNDNVTSNFTTVIGTSITLTINTDGYGEDTGWELRDGSNNILYSEPNNTYGDNATYNIDMCVPDNACYTFTIFDAYGDGLCCSQGQGSYIVKDEHGLELASGGQFTNQESTNFCLPIPAILPQASFSGNNTTVCRNKQVQFSNVDTAGYPATYAWQFQGATPSTNTGATPTVTYNSSGTFDVTLIITNAFGSDTLTLTDYITVLPRPNVSLFSSPETVGQNNGTATANATGGTSPYTYNWSGGNGNTETISGLSTGTYIVTVTDANGCSVTGNTTVGSQVGVEEINLANAIEVYPNPTSGELNVVLPKNVEATAISLYNLVGEQIFNQEIVNKTTLNLNIGDYSHGVYYLTLTINSRPITKKIILTK